jgi:hypothetical protein
MVNCRLGNRLVPVVGMNLLLEMLRYVLDPICKKMIAFVPIICPSGGCLKEGDVIERLMGYFLS